MAGRRAELGKDDGPRQFARPPVAAAREKAAEAPDGERENACGCERVEQLRERPARDPGRHPRRNHARRDPARRRETTVPESFVAAVHRAKEPVRAGERRDGHRGRGDEHDGGVASAPERQHEAGRHTGGNGQRVARDGNVKLADRERHLGVHVPQGSNRLARRGEPILP